MRERTKVAMLLALLKAESVSRPHHAWKDMCFRLTGERLQQPARHRARLLAFNGSPEASRMLCACFTGCAASLGKEC
jgi:hypothetical protein